MFSGNTVLCQNVQFVLNTVRLCKNPGHVTFDKANEKFIKRNNPSYDDLYITRAEENLFKLFVEL